MSDLVGNPEDRVCRDTAHLVKLSKLLYQHGLNKVLMQNKIHYLNIFNSKRDGFKSPEDVYV